METLAAQPTQENRKSYEPLASVNMLRYDLENFDEIQPETRQRVCDEELSYLVEGVDKASRTPFVLRRQDGDVVYFNQGKWESYRSLLLTGLQTAEAEAREDPRKGFLAVRATEDWGNGNIMCDLQPGEQHIWWSSYEHEIEEQFGENFMRQCGRQPDRRMGFLYRAYCNDDGDILLESQTLDKSDPDSFTAVRSAAEKNPGIDMDAMVAVYDGVIYTKSGDECFAGRSSTERNENAWDEINMHRDLIEYHLNTLEEIATSSLTNVELKQATKRHTYGVWAAFKKRIEGQATPHTSSEHAYVSHQIDHQLHVLLEQETREAFKDFASRGIVMAGCGGGFKMAIGENGIMEADGNDVHSSIFGNGDKYGPLTFMCPKGHNNRRPYGKLLDACQHKGCKAKVTC